MYNVFVDAEVIGAIHEVASRLVASAASPAEWASTELGRLVSFTDDRSHHRVRKILSSYTDGSLQDHETLTRVRKERSAALAKYFPEMDGTSHFQSRAMGLSSFRLTETITADSDMRHQYLKDGILDPFPLLRVEGDRSDDRTGKAKHVNPLLLVTERKGTSWSLHYGAFPLDAFNTDVSAWKLRPGARQDDYGKSAPRVTKHQNPKPYVGEGGPTAIPIAPRMAQDAWLATALEEMSQMIGAFLRATVAAQPDTSPVVERLRIDVHVGDALDFCDALLVASPSAGGEGNDAPTTHSSPTVLPPIGFQQATLQPLQLRAGIFGSRTPEFDVIKSSNLADHLGIVNVVAASAPLLKDSAHAVLLTSFLTTVHSLFEEAADFYEELICMDAHTASVLLGVVPVSSISPVVSHADVKHFLDIALREHSPLRNTLESSGSNSQLRLTWKRPVHALASTMQPADSPATRVDISPTDFVSLTLPVYKAMFAHMPKVDMWTPGKFEMAINQAARSATMFKHYTSVSFARLLVLAGRTLRLGVGHFEAARDAVINNSGLILAPNLQQEQAAVFHALGLAPISQFFGGHIPIPLDTRRVVLLVPESGLCLLRAFASPEIYISISGKVQPFDNHFVSVHTAFVKVRRGSSNQQDGHDGWRSLTSHLAVRDAREGDPEAELMVSAVVPTFALMMAPPASTEVQLRPRDSAEMLAAPSDIIKKLGGQFWKVFYKADLANIDQTAVLIPGATGNVFQGRVSHPRLASPEKVAVNRPDNNRSPAQIGRSSSQSPIKHHVMDGRGAVEQSVELIDQAGGRGKARLVYRVRLNMASVEARKILAAAGAPVVDKALDPCTVRVKIGEGMSHVTSFPFPVQRSSIEMKFSKRQGFVLFTVSPLLHAGPQLPFAWTTHDYPGVGHRQVLPSMVSWSPCPPLSSLPRLDFKAEWTHKQVMGGLSFSTAERSLREGGAVPNGNVDQGVLGLKETFLHLASAACTHHVEDRSSVWKPPCLCLSENGRDDEPAIWMFVNEILLESTNEALILDCCILPVERRGSAISCQLGAAIELEQLRGDGAGIAFSKAYPGEMAMWRSLLPLAVERARQAYFRTPDCIYTRVGGSSGELCSCGKGKDLPPAFVESMKLANAVGKKVVVTDLFYRAALSPLFASPEGSSGAGPKKKSVVGGCGKCGKEGKNKKCARCRKIEYCSRECQRLHWKVHKPNCA